MRFWLHFAPAKRFLKPRNWVHFKGKLTARNVRWNCVWELSNLEQGVHIFTWRHAAAPAALANVTSSLESITCIIDRARWPWPWTQDADELQKMTPRIRNSTAEARLRESLPGSSNIASMLHLIWLDASFVKVAAINTPILFTWCSHYAGSARLVQSGKKVRVRM
jgi:hypothetical protein